MPSLKTKLQDTKDRLSSVVCTIPSATVTQALAACGVDSVIIDLEHGAIDYASAHAMIAATAGTSCAPLVRVAQNRPADVKRALDLGAEGIVFPLVRTVEDTRSAVESLRYPPDGTRGFGPFLAQSRWGETLATYPSVVGPELICCILVETVEALENIESICAVPGVDMLIIAQFDLSTELGVMGQFDHPDFVSAVRKVENAAFKAEIPLGNVALSEAQATDLFSRGYRLVGGFDALWLREKALQIQSWCNT